MTAAPLTSRDFAARLDRLGGFEARPRLAVGVSGGADSVALVLLAQAWAAARGGSVLALTIDHGLRPESAAEAARVGAWMATRGIPHAIVRWEGEKPPSGIQAAARAARRRLLAERCHAEGIPHLLFAHHGDDQAETVLLRLARGSGVDGLAGMAAVRWDGPVRLLRPLLDVPHAALEATCRGFAQPWIEDPSNHSAAYARGRLRAVAAALAGEGLSTARLCDTARRAGRARAALEDATVRLLATAATVFPEGWIRLDAAALAPAPEEIGLRALARVLACVGGAIYPPRDAALERLFEELAGGMAGARTLGGCLVVPARGKDRDKIVFAREPEAAGERLRLAPGGTVSWDGRFSVSLSGDAGGALDVARLGGPGWRAALAARPDLATLGLPEPVRTALPGLWSAEGLAAVPTLGFRRAGMNATATVLFSPRVPLGGAAFPVV